MKYTFGYRMLKRLFPLKQGISLHYVGMILSLMMFLGHAQTHSLESIHLTMRDSVKIAIDIFLPEVTAGEKIPTVVRATRYWRSMEILNTDFLEDEAAKEGEIWNTAGYALILVDARGSGASFGTRTSPWSSDEVTDFGEVTDWIIAQDWSNGRVAARGVSYDGNTADFFATVGREAVKVVAPRFSDFDVYADLALPGGLNNIFYTREWGNYNALLDNNDVCAVFGIDPADCNLVRTLIVTGVRPVDADSTGSLLAGAIADHQDNFNVSTAIGQMVHRDDDFNGVKLEAFSPYHYQDAAELHNTTYYVQAGWLDAGTANGALQRFMTFDNPQHVVIGPWGHGAEYTFDPFHPDQQDSLSFEAEMTELINFFNPYMKDSIPPAPAHIIHYYTMNEGIWKTTDVWPPETVAADTFYLSGGNSLTANPPQGAEGADSYAVDFEATSTKYNRWQQDYDPLFEDRRTADERLLTYTSAPLGGELEITGHPEIKLHVASSESDAAFIVYLEAVAPDGHVTYITEGVLRGIHRKISSDTPPYHHFGPYHSYLQEDAADLPIDEIVEIHFAMQPTSVLIEAGHSLRIAIAGHDAETFARVPASGTPTLTFQRNSVYPSQLVLPVIARAPQSIGDEANPAKVFSLKQNYPNPFNPETIIEFQMKRSETVKIDVFDVNGRLVETLLNEQRTAGIHKVRFDGKALSSGTYFYRVQAGELNQVRKMLLMK